MLSIVTAFRELISLFPRTYALQGDLEAMYKYADQAMQALDQTRSMRVLQRMFNLQQELNKWQATMYVKLFGIGNYELFFLRERFLVIFGAPNL
jgi:hypothetical protein